MADEPTGLPVKEIEGDQRWQQMCQTLSEIKQAHESNQAAVATALSEIQKLQQQLFSDKPPERKALQAGHDYVVQDDDAIEMRESPVKVDSKAARYFTAGVSSPAAYKVYQQIRETPKRYATPHVERLHHLNDLMVIGTELMRNVRPGFQPWHFEGPWNEWNRLLAEVPEVKALAAATTAGGAELVPTLMSATMLEDVMVETKVAGLFPVVTMPSNPFTIPVRLSTSNLPYIIGEPVGDAATKIKTRTPTTRKITFTAVNLGFRDLWSEDLNEDSIVAVWDSLVRPYMVSVQANGLDSAIINGDTTATHQDSDTTDADDCRKAWIGLRKCGLQTNYSTSLATFNEANLRTVRKTMGRYGVNPRTLAIVSSLSAHMQMIHATNFPSFITLDKIGPQAAVVNGQVGNFDGSPVISSEHQRENLNASGVYDGTTTTKTALQYVNHRAWVLGRRGEIAIRVREDPDDTDQWVAVTKQRADFVDVVDYTANKIATCGYNITS